MDEVLAEIRKIRESQIRAEPAVKLAFQHELLLKGKTGVNGLTGDVAVLKGTEKRRQAGYKRMWGVLVVVAGAVAGSLVHTFFPEK